MNLKKKFLDQFNAERIAEGPATEHVQFMLYAHGYKAGMEAAAELLKAEWFRTQADCELAIVRAAAKL